jgi:hypothetical protein
MPFDGRARVGDHRRIALQVRVADAGQPVACKQPGVIDAGPTLNGSRLRAVADIVPPDACANLHAAEEVQFRTPGTA